MKMKKYYSVLKARAEHWFSDVNHRQQWAEYVTQVVKEGEYHDLRTYLAWDMARAFTTGQERSDWIADCGANDSAFTTLAKKVGQEVGYF